MCRNALAAIEAFRKEWTLLWEQAGKGSSPSEEVVREALGTGMPGSSEVLLPGSCEDSVARELWDRDAMEL